MITLYNQKLGLKKHSTIAAAVPEVRNTASASFPLKKLLKKLTSSLTKGLITRPLLKNINNFLFLIIFLNQRRDDIDERRAGLICHQNIDHSEKYHSHYLYNILF